jgi:hypothetical protein
VAQFGRDARGRPLACPLTDPRLPALPLTDPRLPAWPAAADRLHHGSQAPSHATDKSQAPSPAADHLRHGLHAAAGRCLHAVSLLIRTRPPLEAACVRVAAGCEPRSRVGQGPHSLLATLGPGFQRGEGDGTGRVRAGGETATVWIPDGSGWLAGRRLAPNFRVCAVAN